MNMEGKSASDFFKSYPRAGKRRRFFEPVVYRENSSKEVVSNQELKASLEAVLGPLPAEALEQLVPLAANDLSSTINRWLDGEISISKKESDAMLSGSACVELSPATCDQQEENNASEEPLVPSSSAAFDDLAGESLLFSCLPNSQSQKNQHPDAQASCPELTADVEDEKWSRKFLGSFHAALWSTRTGSNLVKYGEELKFERPPAIVRSSGHEDFIIRVKNENNLDFARVSERDAKFMAVLMDLQICEFEGSCVFVDKTLRSGDSIDVQVNCYLCKKAFFSDIREVTFAPTVSGEAETRRLKGFVNEADEATSETLVRQRQVAVILLFAKLGFSSPKMPDPETSAELLSTATDQLSGEDQTLTDDQINVLSDRASSRPALPETDPPDSFTFNLHGYQKQALSWMLEKEGVEQRGNETKLLAPSRNPDDLHPLWSKFEWPGTGNQFFVNFNSGEFSLIMPTLETTSLGGILADEMGLGKTITTAALIHTSRLPSSLSGHLNVTLIVVPMSLLGQWESELVKSSKSGTMKILTYYGARGGELKQFISAASQTAFPRVILTSYGIIASEYRQMRKFRDINGLSMTTDTRDRGLTEIFGLFAINFHRVVLDEAHSIKNRNTLSSKACCELRAAKRWALTGTPVVNRLEDLFSLIKFLGLEPWRNFSFWRAFITIPFQTRSGVQDALKTVQSIVAPLCLRRTKQMKRDGKPLIDLPEKTVEVRRIPFTPVEHDLYAFIYNRIRLSVSKEIKGGTATKNYAGIMTLILRVRQVCCHAKLLPWAERDTIHSSDDENDETGTQTLESSNLELDYPAMKKLMQKFYEVGEKRPGLTESILKVAELTESEIECPICSNESIPTNELASTKCLHFGCFCCLLAHINFQQAKGYDTATCPMCREPICAGDLYLVNTKRKTVKRNNPGQQSAKTFALIEELRKNPGNGKHVVFSQFTSFLDIIANELDFQDIRHVRFDGSMDMRTRSAALDEFRNAKGDCVLLLSLKAGGVGLNLVEAQQAFLMDPWWSHAIEEQAIDRIHRMGQTGRVRVVRFIIEGTIEERILKIQARKAALSSAVTDEDKRSEQLDNIRDLFEIDDA